MKWLAALLLGAFLNVAHAAAPFDINNVEGGLFIQFSNSTGAGKSLCLQNKTQKDILAEGWKWYTCNDLNTQLKWHECAINPERNEFMCRPLHDRIKGVSL